jgi:GDPmannose 4,6-dehydratase
MNKVLILGISGQDGAYLAEILLDKGYEVYGTSRDLELNSFDNLRKLGIYKEVSLLSVALSDFGSVYQCFQDIKADEIYNLAGQSSVGLSFSQPNETYESIIIGTLNCLEAIRLIKKDIRYYNACSSECFGDTNNKPATENTSFNPQSPYAVAKATSYWTTKNYRESYNLFACSGILFNHESPLRPERYVTQKIISGAIAISKGKQDFLELGNIDICRDWGWAPEYVQAMHLILKQDKPEDFIIATGNNHSIKDFLLKAFSYFDLDWSDYVKQSKEFYRPSDLRVNSANPAKANDILGWKASFSFNDIVREMIVAKLNQLDS